jgi:hypothetical protein
MLTPDGWVEAVSVPICYGNLFKASTGNFKNTQIIFDNGQYDWEGKKNDVVGKRNVDDQWLKAINHETIVEKKIRSNEEALIRENYKKKQPEVQLAEAIADFFGIQKHYQDEPREISNKKRSNEDVSGISVKWNQATKTVTVHTNWPGHTQLKLRKTALQKSYNCDMDQNDFVLDDDWILTSESILYQIYVNETLKDDGALATRVITNCGLSDCIACHDIHLSWPCLTPAFKGLIIGAPIIGLLLVIAVLVAVSLGIYICLGPRKTENHNYTHPMVVATILLKFAMLAGACELSLSLKSDGFICQQQGDLRVCQLTEQVLIQIPLMGSTICYDLVDEKNDNLIMGRLMITYVEMKSTLSLNQNYYTSDYVVETTSVHNCAGGAQCVTGNDCNTNRTGLDYRHAGGALNSHFLDNPGLTGCFTIPGCITNGCILCAPGCLYYGWGIVPEGVIYRVSSPSVLSKRPQIKICYIEVGGNPICQNVIMTTGSQTTVGPGIKIQYQGSLSGSTSIFGDNKFIVAMDGSGAYYGPSASNTLMVSGAMGDIQSQTEGGLNNPTLNSFGFATDIAMATDGGEGTALFQVRNSGAKLLPQYPKFPKLIGDIDWHLDGNNAFVGVDNNPGTLNIVLFLNNLTLSQEIDLVCPEMSSAGIKGVYQADGGATWSVLASSSCSTGPCLLTVDDDGVHLTRSSLMLYEKATYYYAVNFTATNKKGIVTLKCSAMGKEASITDSYDLGDPTVIINNETVPIVIPGQPTDGGGSFDVSIGMWVGFSFGGVLLFIFLGLGIFFCIYGAKSFSMTTVKNSVVMGRSKDESDIELLEDDHL